MVLIGLMLASGIFICGAIGQVSASFFYSIGDTATPMKVAYINAIIGLLMRVIMVVHFGVLGVLFGATIHQLLNFAVLHFLAKRQISANA